MALLYGGKDKLLAENNRQKIKTDAYGKKSLMNTFRGLAEYEKYMEEERVEIIGWRMVLAGRAACI